jgi:LysM repeat protein
MKNQVRFIPFTRLLPLMMVAAFAVGCASQQAAQAPQEEKAVAETKPAPAPAPAPAAAAPAPEMLSYNVVRGDHLWGISAKPTIYGNPYQWPLIFKANRDKIQDADVIEPGWVLSIDKNPGRGDIDEAVLHARTRGEWSLSKTEESDTRYLARYGMK